MAASVSEASGTAAPNGAPGSQTLARGLAALQLVATSPTGLTVQEVADDIGVHRTIAYRLLSTLAQFRMVAKGELLALPPSRMKFWLRARPPATENTG